MISFGTPTPDEWPSRLDRAINAGFDPGGDYGHRAPLHLRAGEGVNVLAVWGAETRALHIVGPLTRCHHPHCRTTVTEDTVTYCPHNRPFCGMCVWEDGCDGCANGQPNDYGKAS